MPFIRVTSPHAHTPQDTATVMRLVLAATIPGVLTLTWFFGYGVLVNIALACAVAAASEAAVLALRRRPVLFYLRDCSAMVTATLLAIALPPLAPWWVVLVGTAFAIVVAKHLYGGLGYNPFNPAMAAYVVLLISFPVQMTTWAAPQGASAAHADVLGLVDAVRVNFGLVKDGLDGFTMATPLDVLKQNRALTMADLWDANPQFGLIGGRGWEWVNLAFLLGGVFLLYRRVFTWHAPAAMLATLTLMAAMGYDSGSSASGGSPLFHLFTGASMFGAFFIVTDPVTSAVSVRGRVLYGALIGLLVYVIRTWGNYPDAVAFSVLLANFAAPFIDFYTQPRTYGHQ